MRNLVLALIASIAPLAAHAADIQVVNDAVVYRGPVAMGDAMRFRVNLTAAANRGQAIHTIRLDSPGGLVAEAMDIASQVRSAGLDSEVEAGGLCASACFLPFSAGRAKHVGQGARVGVHNATTTFGVGPDSVSGTAIMVLQAQGFGVSDRVLARLAANPSVGMGWLSDEELASMGATVTPGAPPVPLALTGSAPTEAIGSPGNSWSDPATVKYDERRSAEYKAISTQDGSAALARFNASPLHHLITGD